MKHHEQKLKLNKKELKEAKKTLKLHEEGIPTDPFYLLQSTKMVFAGDKKARLGYLKQLMDFDNIDQHIKDEKVEKLKRDL